jgi:hypothetical protein
LQVLTHPALLGVASIGYLLIAARPPMLFLQLMRRRYERASAVLTLIARQMASRGSASNG